MYIPKKGESMCFRPAEASMNDHNICDACGVENPPGEEVCSNCGAALIKKTTIAKPATSTGMPPAAPSVKMPPKAPKVNIPKP